MTVKELLTKADLYAIAEKEAKIDLEEYNRTSENIIPFSLEDITNKIYKNYEKMLEIKENKHPENIIVCYWVIDLEDEESCFYDATLYTKDDLLNKEFCHFNYFDDNVTSNNGWDDERYVTSYSFEFDDWKDILGYEVADESINKYGADAVANAILNEMTFFGFDYDKSNEEKEKEINILNERVNDVKENKDNLKKYKTLNDLYEEFGWERPTQEEIENNRLKWRKEADINQTEKETIVLRLQERLRKEK